MQLLQFTDSHSIFSALESEKEKPPTDKGSTYHHAFLEECLTLGILTRLYWIDTRDMVMDGLTKGSTLRQALHDFMDGTWTIVHPHKSLHRKVSEAMSSTSFL